MFTYEMRPRRITTPGGRRGGSGSRAPRGGARRSGSPARGARSRARPRATSSSAPVAATRTSAPSSGPPASARADDLVLARREDQRQRRRPLAEVDAGDLPGLDRLAGAVEDVVRDLERDPEREPERAESCPRAEHAGRLEELPGLQRAALEIGLDRRVRVVRLAALHRLAAGEAERASASSETARASPVAASSANARAKR